MSGRGFPTAPAAADPSPTVKSKPITIARPGGRARGPGAEGEKTSILSQSLPPRAPIIGSLPTPPMMRGMPDISLPAISPQAVSLLVRPAPLTSHCTSCVEAALAALLFGPFLPRPPLLLHHLSCFVCYRVHRSPGSVWWAFPPPPPGRLSSKPGPSSRESSRVASCDVFPIGFPFLCNYCVVLLYYVTSSGLLLSHPCAFRPIAGLSVAPSRVRSPLCRRCHFRDTYVYTLVDSVCIWFLLAEPRIPVGTAT